MTTLTFFGLGLIALYAGWTLVRFGRGPRTRRSALELVGHLLAAGALAAWLIEPPLGRPTPRPLTGLLVVAGHSPDLSAERKAWLNARSVDGTPIRWTEADLDALPTVAFDGTVLLTDRPPGDLSGLPGPLDIRLPAQPDSAYWIDLNLPVPPVAGREAVLTATLRLDSTVSMPRTARLTVADSTLAEAPLRPAGPGEASATFAFRLATAGPLPLMLSFSGGPPEPILLDVAPEPTMRVGLLEGAPRWETRFLRQQLETEPGLILRATAALGRNLAKTTAVGVDTARRSADPLAALDSTDVLILGDPSAFPTGRDAARLVEWVHDGGGLIVLLADSSKLPPTLAALLPASPRAGPPHAAPLIFPPRPPDADPTLTLADRLARRLGQIVRPTDPLPELSQVPLSVAAPLGALGDRVGLGRVALVGWTDTWRLALAGGDARRVYRAFWRELLTWTGDGDQPAPWGVRGPALIGLPTAVVPPEGAVSMGVSSPTGTAPLDPAADGAFTWTPKTVGLHHLIATLADGRTVGQPVQVVAPDSSWRGLYTARLARRWAAERRPNRTMGLFSRPARRIPTWSSVATSPAARAPLPPLLWATLALLGLSLAWTAGRSDEC